MTGTEHDFDVVLVLSGSNALSACKAEVYQWLHDNGLQPVISASIRKHVPAVERVVFETGSLSV